MYIGMGKLSSIKSYKSSSKSALSFAQLLINKPAWAQYSASSWSGTTLTDLTTNGRNATTSGVSQSTASGNGATATISYLAGTTSNSIQFPTGSQPSTYTIALIDRYVATNQKRILTTNSNTLGSDLYGHWNALRGVAYQEGTWNTPQTNTGTNTNWLNIVMTNSTSIAVPNNVLVDSVARGTVNGGVGGYTLSINGSGSLEQSDFQFSQLIIWNQALTTTEMSVVATALNTYLTTGVLQ